jgi:outer membrane protein assembly factor BamB
MQLKFRVFLFVGVLAPILALSQVVPASAEITYPSPSKIVSDEESNGFLTRVTTPKKPLFCKAYSGGYTAAPLLDESGLLYVAPSREFSASLVEISVSEKRKIRSWDFEEGAIVGTPLKLPKNRMAILTSYADVFFLDQISGKFLCRKTYTGGFTGSGVLYTDKSGKTYLLAGGADGDLLGLNLDTGEKIFATELGVRLSGSPVLGDGHIGFVSSSGIFCLGTNPSDLTTFKKFETIGSVQTHCCYSKGRFYFGTPLGRVYGISTSAQELICRDLGKVSGEQVSIGAGPLVMDEGKLILVADTAGRLHFFDTALNEKIIPIELGVRTDTDMALSADGRFVAIPSSEGTLIVYDSKTGVLTKAAGYGPLAQPTFGPNGMIYIADNAGQVNILKINSTPER